MSSSTEVAPTAYRWFPSFRMLTSALLCFAFASVHIMNSNMGMAIICMLDESDKIAGLNLWQNSTPISLNRPMKTHKMALSGQGERGVLWSTTEQAYVFSAFNVGLLLMLGTGFMADKFNAKYLILLSVIVGSGANIAIPLLSSISVYYVVTMRFFVGLSDALLQPSINSLLTRWFPAVERSYALGIATGGRQLGTLLILPISGFLCSQRKLFDGWPAIFYLSAFFGITFCIFYSAVGADKPSKQPCISQNEVEFIVFANKMENVGKKRINRSTPWRHIIKSAPVWAAIISVVCHEFPLMTMIMFLPSYLRDVHNCNDTPNGILSALPTASLWISKLSSSYVRVYLERKLHLSGTAMCKLLNTVASTGLAVFLASTTVLDVSSASLAIVLLCASTAAAGLHTPGCQTALLSIAPAYSGAITGLAFFFVASSGIVHPLITKWIVKKGTPVEWNAVFSMSAIVAFLPVIVFNVWGSADVQWWARSKESLAEMSRELRHKAGESLSCSVRKTSLP
ncbi:hypothetical protein AB6A40_007923 [Gnathostoma spinigerum]|uniref:Major facilitator superfamily (MFS) profile domain-containing protein n=1 Tax=Gnathostoma spinigerum TaxID=75299 RepID=A0ABD6EVD0_9BILA